MQHMSMLKRGRSVGKTKRGNGTKIMAIANNRSLPISLGIEGASRHESQLAERAIRSCYTANLPQRVVGDKAYDSDPLDERLRCRDGVELIAPHKCNRKRKTTQDGRPLRRYKRRWKIERFFAWLFAFRRVKVRHDYKDTNFLGFVVLASVIIILRNL